MSAQQRKVSRRQLVAELGGGLASGALFGTGFVIADRWLSHPIIALVGQDDSQVALVLTTSSRVMMVLGPWRAELIEAILPVLGWSDRHVGLVLASAGDATQARAWYTNQRIVRRLVLVGNGQVADPSVPEPYLDRSMVAQLDANTRLRIEPSFEFVQTNVSASRSPWTAVVERGQSRIWFTATTRGLGLVAPPRRPSVLVIPNGKAFAAATAIKPRAIACNAGVWMSALPLTNDQETADSNVALIRTFSRDPAILELSGTGVHLPDWTTHFTPTTEDYDNHS